MTETITQAAAVEMALKEASRKEADGHFYKVNDPAAEQHDWSKGDPETVYSLASVYSQWADDPAAAETAITAALAEKYGEDYL